ncbi:MAG TPA: hypothetical protein VFA55_00915, partial [Candidatus Kapabacteria bacterium]|nr:hypothetical protein [Candidatus Kapabacteria bacterium]
YPDIQLSAGHLDMNGTELWDTFSGSVQMGSQLNMSGHAIVDGTGTISMGNNVDMGGHQISNLGELDNGANPVTMGSTLDLNGHFITDNNTGVVHIADPAGANDNISIGENNTVTGNNGATAIGNGNTASGSSTLAEGNAVTASGPNSVAMGQANDAAGYASAVIGQNDTATGNEAMAFGQNLTATGANSIVLGHSATANNAGSFVFGDGSARAFDNAADEFIALATGGVTFYTNAAQTNFVQIQSAGNLTNNTANPIFAGGSDGIGAQGLNWAINAQGYALSLTNNQNVAGHPGEGLGILVADQTSSNWALNVTNTSGQLFGVRGDGVVTVTNGNLTMNGNQINNVSELNNGGSGLTIGNGTEAATIPNAVVQSGSIDNTPIGATTPSTGVFTAVSAKANSTAANPYAVAASDFLVTETTGGAAVDLPAATAGAGRMVVVNNGSAGAVTVTPSGTDTIAGAANFNLAASGNSVTLISDGVSNWVVMGSH